MVCYLPRTGTFAVIGFAVYLVWHKAIMHVLGMVGTATEIALLLGAEVAVAIVLIRTGRMIRRRRAQAGACTTCRFRCQEALQSRPNLLVNRVDRRITPPPPARPVVRTCHPAAPILGRPRTPARPAFDSRPAAAFQPAPAAPVSRPAPAPGPAPASRPAAAFQPASAAPVSRPAPDHASRPAAAAQAPRPFPAARRTPATPRHIVPARKHWPLASRPVTCEPVTSVEAVPFDGYVLTPDGVDAEPAPAAEAH